MNIVGHSPQHHVHDLFRRIAARGTVPVDFLNPFKIDNWNNADLEIRILGNIHLARFNRSVQTFIEEEITPFRQSLPGRKFPWGTTVIRSLFLIMNIMPCFTNTRLAVAAEYGFEFFEKVCINPEMTKVAIALKLLCVHYSLHFVAIIPVERISLDE